MPTNNIDITACLVRNSAKTNIPDFLKSWYAAGDPVSVEAIVVDLVSDQTTEAIHAHFPEVVLFETGGREDLPRSLNRALELAHGRYILLADEHLEINAETLTALLAILDNSPETGIFAPALVDPTGKELASAWSLPGIATWMTGYPFPAPRPRILAHDAAARTVGVDWAGGPCLIVRHETLTEIGSLDEGYRRAYHDLDLCRRARRGGWHIVRMPGIRLPLSHPHLYHRQGVSFPGDLGRFFLKKWFGLATRKA